MDPARPWRPSGILVVVALVVTGVGVTAGYLQWKAPEVGDIISQRRREVAAAPTTPQGRLSKWIEYGAPQIHHYLATNLRFSTSQPWLVTHAVGTDPGTLEIHGIDLGGMPQSVARLDGSTVRVRLPAPKVLARGPLEGSNAMAVPVVATDPGEDYGIERARYLVGFALDRLGQGLERDIPGARLSIEIGPGEAWER